ncbi:hypothetical protein [Virgibacillus oceani]|uniref:hypothetical protein n=1 Tax=Virgibacillus oceani TaxID=1479511 RepID=UPI001E60386E|nr:hypothetical protein [Virgibacillus oceani]
MAKYAALFMAIMYFLIALSQLFALHSSGYSFELNENHDKLFIHERFSDEDTTVPVSDQNVGKLLYILNTEQLLENDWELGSALVSLLIVCLVFFKKSKIPIISNSKVSVPLFLILLLVIIIVQLSHFGSEIQELQHHLTQLRMEG